MFAESNELIAAIDDLIDFIQGNFNEVNTSILEEKDPERIKELKVLRAAYNSILTRMCENGLMYASGSIKKVAFNA